MYIYVNICIHMVEYVAKCLCVPASNSATNPKPQTPHHKPPT